MFILNQHIIYIRNSQNLHNILPTRKLFLYFNLYLLFLQFVEYLRFMFLTFWIKIGSALSKFAKLKWFIRFDADMEYIVNGHLKRDTAYVIMLGSFIEETKTVKDWNRFFVNLVRMKTIDLKVY